MRLKSAGRPLSILAGRRVETAPQASLCQRQASLRSAPVDAGTVPRVTAIQRQPLGRKSMCKQFLAAGDYLINPELLTYAVIERGTSELCLRLGFSNRGADTEGELRLMGDVASEVLRWLRLNAIFLSTAGGFGSSGIPARGKYETESRSFARGGTRAIGESWGTPSMPQHEKSSQFLSQAQELS